MALADHAAGEAAPPDAKAAGASWRCGLVALAGRANVGKSTLLNALVGTKASIVSAKPQTTRWPVRAVLTQGAAQAVFVDTPGLHKPRTLLGQHLNRAALGAAEEADTVVLVVDASSGVGRGDRFVAERLARSDILVVNKVDGLSRAQVLSQLEAVSGWGFLEYFPVSARTGAGVAELREALLDGLPQGPFLYPEGAAGPRGPQVQLGTDEREWVAELVREQLLALAHEELPYSIACQVTQWDWPFVHCEIWVERPSQKAIVIGKGGSVLKRVGTAVRQQLPRGAYLELSVRTEPRWQQKPEVLGRLGL